MVTNQTTGDNTAASTQKVKHLQLQICFLVIGAGTNHFFTKNNKNIMVKLTIIIQVANALHIIIRNHSILLEPNHYSRNISKLQNLDGASGV